MHHKIFGSYSDLYSLPFKYSSQGILHRVFFTGYSSQGILHRKRLCNSYGNTCACEAGKYNAVPV
jgi:hypothetical protein